MRTTTSPAYAEFLLFMDELTTFIILQSGPLERIHSLNYPVLIALSATYRGFVITTFKKGWRKFRKHVLRKDAVQAL